MPQFDLAIFPAQIFWLVIFFSILMVYTVAVSVPRMKKLLEERWEKTEGYRIEASRYSDDHKVLLQTVDEGINQAKSQAQEIVSKAQGEVARDFADRKNEMMLDLKQKMSEAEARILDEKKKAVLEIKGHTQSITQGIISKLLPVASNQDEIASVLESKMNVKVSNGN